MTKRRLTWILGVLVGLVLIWYLFFRKKEQPLVLQTEKAQRGNITESVTATGTVQPVDTTSVGTRVSGTIEAIYADFNSTVKKGQLLAVLDKSLLQATVDQTRAALSEAKSNLSYQLSNFNRQKQLLETGSISRAEYELALNNYRSAAAGVKNIEAQLRSAVQNIAFTNIYSPVNGVVLNRSVNVGQTVAASFSTPTLFVIARDITRMQVQAAVDEADIGSVDDGQRATFTVDAFLNDVFKGTVQEIRLRPNRTSNVVTYTTIINAPNKELKLKPGMTANITIYTKEANNVLLVSTRALQFRPDSSMAKEYTITPLPRNAKTNVSSAPGSEGAVKDANYVWVLEGKVLKQKKIETGLNNNTQVQVLSGLSANELVVTGIAPAAGEEAGQQSSPFVPKRGGGRR
ncbi:efflux RND transporter periplasmic adaptor subunit [Desertivirga xinjiangensis]|uniref:efflux RND transporter periplasmic adaptor subunit n=1 Tax=Desertivirga xinjiangensis TaxID=539206 RepID=UPI00210B3A01|nr:efflux RND transporter periplasmic adaptor subunit [Pedobacter xinjiangensis]